MSEIVSSQNSSASIDERQFCLQSSLVNKIKRQKQMLKNTIHTFKRAKMDFIQNQKQVYIPQLQIKRKDNQEKQSQWNKKIQQTQATLRGSQKSGKDVEALLNNIRQLQRQKTQLRKMLNQIQVYHEERYQKLKCQYEQLKQELNSNNALNEQIQKERQKTKQLTKSKIELSRKIDSLKQNLKKYQELQKKKKEKSDQQKVLNQKINSLEAINLQYEQKINSLEMKVFELQQLLNQTRQEINTKNKQNYELIDKISQLKDKIDLFQDKPKSQLNKEVVVSFNDLVDFLKFYFSKLQNRSLRIHALFKLRNQLDSIKV